MTCFQNPSLLLLLVFILTITIQYSYQINIRRLSNEETESLHSRIQRKAGNDKVTFPEEPERGVQRAADPPSSPTPCPNDEPYCTSAQDYPKERIKTSLQQQPKVILENFYDDIFDDQKPLDKFGPSSGEENLCATKIEVVYPNKAKSKEGFYEFVVNDEKNKQGVKVERCLNKDLSCNNIISFPLGYKSYCVQKYVTRVLVVAETNQSDVHGFVSKPFDFPSCCSCVLKLEDASRFGQSLAASTSNKKS